MFTDVRDNIKKLKLLSCIVILITIVSCKFYFNTTKDNFKAVDKDNAAAHGKKLTFTICGDCHFDKATERLSGIPLSDFPKIGGRLYSANLTHSTTNGIPDKYSDAELFYLLKTGIARNGKFMPFMMKPMMADDDINDIIIYLRSDDKALTAIDKTTGLTHLNFIGKMGLRLAAKPTPYNKGIAKPDENNDITYGKYLVAIIGCYQCHSASKLKIDYEFPEKSKGYLQGGMKMKDNKGQKIYSPNLTPDKETGIGNYTNETFTKALRDGIADDGMQLMPPMPRFKQLNDKDIHAIYAYLKSVPAVKHKVKRM